MKIVSLPFVAETRIISRLWETIQDVNEFAPAPSAP